MYNEDSSFNVDSTCQEIEIHWHVIFFSKSVSGIYYIKQGVDMVQGRHNPETIA
jgi:hypothetical protein